MSESAVSSPVQGRLGKWDNLKGFLMIMVVMGHFVNQYAAYSTMMRSIALFIYSFHMPLFIFLAGLFSKKWDGTRPFNWSRPLYFFILGYLLKILIYAVKVAYHKDDGFTPFADTGLPWYMFAMAAFMILSWLVRNCNPWILMPIWIVAACLAGYLFWINSVLSLSRIIVFFPFYYLGYELDQKQVRSFTDRPWVRVVSVLVIGLTIWLCFTRIDTLFPYIRLLTSRNPYSTIHVAGIGFKDRLLFYLITSIISTAFISLTPAPAIPLLHTTGSRTLQIYFWHRPILYVLMFCGLVSASFLSSHLPRWELWIPGFSVLLTFLLTPAVFGWPLDQLRKWVDQLVSGRSKSS